MSIAYPRSIFKLSLQVPWIDSNKQTNKQAKTNKNKTTKTKQNKNKRTNKTNKNQNIKIKNPEQNKTKQDHAKTCNKNKTKIKQTQKTSIQTKNPIIPFIQSTLIQVLLSSCIEFSFLDLKKNLSTLKISGSAARGIIVFKPADVHHH